LRKLCGEAPEHGNLAGKPVEVPRNEHDPLDNTKSQQNLSWKTAVAEVLRKPHCGTREFYRIIVRFLMGSPGVYHVQNHVLTLGRGCALNLNPTVANVKLENARLLRTETETKTTAGSKLNLPVRTF
jgi:hypothetical protein